MFKLKRKKAFTLPESMMVLVVIGLITVLTIATNLNVDTLKRKQTIAVSQDFYSTVMTTLQNTLIHNSANYDLRNLYDENGDTLVDAVDLRNYFVKYLSGEVIDCSEILITSSEIKDYIESSRDPQCAYFTPKIKAAFVYDKDCALSITAKEYLSKDDTTSKKQETTDDEEEYLPASGARIVNNVCGYILYSYINSEGIFEKDVFTIPFGTSRVK